MNKNDLRSLFSKPAVTMVIDKEYLTEMNKYVINAPSGNISYNLDDLPTDVLYIIETDESSELRMTPYAITVDTGSRTVVVADMRPYVNKEGTVRNQSDADIMVVNAYYESMWSNEDYASIYSETLLAAQIYVSILTRQLVNLYRLEQKDMFLVRVVTALRYIYMFNDTMEEEEIIAKVSRIASLDYLIVEDVLKYIDDKEVLTWTQYCDIIKEKSNNVKLSKIKTAVIIELFTKIFHCTDCKKKMMMALDHPPVWLSVVYAASNDKRFKRTLLGSLMAGLPREARIDRDEYVKMVDNNIRYMKIR